MTVDFEKAVCGSFDWVRRRESLKYALIISGLQLLSVLLSVGIAMLFLSAMLPGFWECITSQNCELLTKNMTLSADRNFFSTFLIWVLLLIFVVVVLSLLIGVLTAAIVNLYALRAFGFKPVPFTVSKYLRYILFNIATVLAILFWSFDKRLRIVQIFCLISFFILAILSIQAMSQLSQSYSHQPNYYIQPIYEAGSLQRGIVNAITGFVTAQSYGSRTTEMPYRSYAYNTQSSYSTTNRNAFSLLTYILLAICLLIPYGIIAIYNSMRLYLSNLIFLNKDISIIAALKESWALMKGNVLIVLLASLVVGFILLLILFAAGVILDIIFTIATAGMFPAYSLTTDAQGYQAYLIGLIVTESIWPAIKSVILSPISLLTIAFLPAAIYSMVASNKTAAANSEA